MLSIIESTKVFISTLYLLSNVIYTSNEKTVTAMFGISLIHLPVIVFSLQYDTQPSLDALQGSFP